MASKAYHKFLVFFNVLALLVPVVVFAQGDDFPPAGIFIPCCSSGGTGGHTGATYGENGQSAWKQVWGAAPGDIVTFQFVLRARSAGSLHAYPRTTGGSDPQYIGDYSYPYQTWYWNTQGRRDKGGTFCLDCLWQCTANYWDPWIYIDYWDSGDGWDVDLNVTNIQTPKRQVIPQAKKDAAREKAGKQLAWATSIGVVGSQCRLWWPACVGIAALSGAFALDSYRQSNIANDPPRSDYWVIHEPRFDFPIN